MSGKRIDVTIMRGGKIKIEAIGYSGPACEAATRQIEEALGQVEDREKLPEFYQSTETGVQQHTSS